MPFNSATVNMLLEGTRDTLFMVIVSTFMGYVLGMPIGILLAVTDVDGISPHRVLYRIVDIIVNIMRSIPFLIMVESSLKEVDRGVIEAAQSMGAGKWTIIWKVLVMEARTSLLVGVTIALGTILGYSAMAGTVGGGGLGDIAIRYGYYRYEFGIMVVTVIILVVLVQILQGIGMMLSKKLDRRRA